MVLLFSRNPACSFLKMFSIPFLILLINTLPKILLKQSSLTIKLKNLTTKQRKNSPRFGCGFLAKCFSSGSLRNCVREIIEPGTSYFDQNTKKRNFLALKDMFFYLSWLLPDFSFFTGRCTGLVVRFTAFCYGTTFLISKLAVSVCFTKAECLPHFSYSKLR